MTTHRCFAAMLAAILGSPLVGLSQETIPLPPVAPGPLPLNIPAPTFPDMAPIAPLDLTRPPTNTSAPTSPEALPMAAPLDLSRPSIKMPAPLSPATAPLTLGEPNRMPVNVPAPLFVGSTAPNPALAHGIARLFQESGRLSQYRIHVYAFGNNIDLVGEVADDSQRDVVLQVLRTVPGLGIVRDWIQVRPPMPAYTYVPAYTGQGMADHAPYGHGGLIPVQGPILQPLPGKIPPIGDAGKGEERIDGQLPEPQPIMQAPLAGPNPQMQPPPMPPYAWPTFAPYNNYSRVAYPNAYPYEQWPFIGPIYPFPRVPLGWRSVTLTWEDGHWWYHRNPTGHDWWRIRYH